MEGKHMTDEQFDKILYAMALNITMQIAPKTIDYNIVKDANFMLRRMEEWTDQVYTYLKNKEV
jgi:hypothetical protein